MCGLLCVVRGACVVCARVVCRVSVSVACIVFGVWCETVLVQHMCAAHAFAGLAHDKTHVLVSYFCW